jgi:5-methylcytosine-specific restriction endonuclease McrA
VIDAEKRRIRQRGYNRRYYLRHRAEVLARQRAYAQTEHRRAYAREWARRNAAEDPQGIREAQQQWYARNRALVYLRRKARERTDPDLTRDRIRVTNSRRRAGTGFTVIEWEQLVSAYNGRCAYCGDRTRLEADHRTPVARGGANTIDNIVPACPSCNRRKAKRTEAEYVAARLPFVESELADLRVQARAMRTFRRDYYRTTQPTLI